MLSIVIPIHNEEHSILPLYDRLSAVLEQVKRPYEILFVDDASSDRSFELLASHRFIRSMRLWLGSWLWIASVYDLLAATLPLADAGLRAGGREWGLRAPSFELRAGCRVW